MPLLATTSTAESTDDLTVASRNVVMVTLSRTTRESVLTMPTATAIGNTTAEGADEAFARAFDQAVKVFASISVVFESGFVPMSIEAVASARDTPANRLVVSRPSTTFVSCCENLLPKDVGELPKSDAVMVCVVSAPLIITTSPPRIVALFMETSTAERSRL